MNTAIQWTLLHLYKGISVIILYSFAVIELRHIPLDQRLFSLNYLIYHTINLCIIKLFLYKKYEKTRIHSIWGSLWNK